MNTKKRYIREPQGSFFLFGPRGTGKTTWLKQIFTDALTINLLEPDLCRRYTAYPERIGEVIEANHDADIFVIDEIQRVPELLSSVHKHIEESGKRFILTCSSARKLKRSGVDLLGGRAAYSAAHPFMASELGNDFSLEKAVVIGTVPVVLDAVDPAQTLSAYISLYLREEVAAEGLVRNIGNFTRFLEAISFSHGSLLSISDVARECEVSRKTVEGFVSILEDLLIGQRLPVFSKRAKRRLIKHSKFYYFDTGVFRSIRPCGPLDRRDAIDGAALEGLIYQHLRGWVDYSSETHNLYFWRTGSGTEVDFVLYGSSQFCALEVKNAGRVTRRDVRSLKTFRSDYPESRVALLYRGRERIMVDDVLCIPCEEFLRELKPDNAILP